MTYNTKYYKVRGLKLAYHEWGPTNAPVIFFFHGFLDHGLSFDPAAKELATDFRVIAPDARGYGHSDWIGDGGYYHFADYYHDISTLVEKLEIKELHLVGHSMRGSIATGVAAILGNRIRSTVLLEGMGPRNESLDDLPKRLSQWHRDLSETSNAQNRETRKQSRKWMPDLATAARRLQSINARLSKQRAHDLARTFTEAFTRLGQTGLAWRYDPLHRTIEPKPFRFEEVQYLWKNNHSSVLSLWGRDSALRPENLRQRHDCLRDVQVATIDDAGHNIHHDQPEIVARLIRDWVTGNRFCNTPKGVHIGR